MEPDLFLRLGWLNIVMIVVLIRNSAGLLSQRHSLVLSAKARSSSFALPAPFDDDAAAFGLYKPFADQAWKRLMKTCGGQLETVDLPSDLSSNETPAPGGGGGTVKMTIRAAKGTGPIQYARYALLETIGGVEAGAGGLQTAGIQVLNMVLFPPANTGLPVFGADFVSLPGNKHLLLLDAQPMVSRSDSSSPNVTIAAHHWKEWYDRHCPQFPWGGDLPEKVQPYVSPHALWTRLGATSPRDDNNNNNNQAVTPRPPDDPVPLIQGPVMSAFTEHLDLYLDLIMTEQQQTIEAAFSSHRKDYIRYRLENDPARPMLKRLYGEEWTEKVLHTVLFPQLLE